MDEQEYKNAVQLLLSQEGNNYILGLYFLLEHKSLEHICDLIQGEYLNSKYLFFTFGDYKLACYLDSERVVSWSNHYHYVTYISKNKPKYKKELFRREIHKHLIRIFDSLV